MLSSCEEELVPGTELVTPGKISEELLLQAVKVLLCIKVLMLVRDRDVEAILWLKQVPVLMLWQFVFKLNTCTACTIAFQRLHSKFTSIGPLHCGCD